eukprot:359139-Chlamydomonas_euryale.AAC.4
MRGNAASRVAERFLEAQKKRGRGRGDGREAVAAWTAVATAEEGVAIIASQQQVLLKRADFCEGGQEVQQLNRRSGEANQEYSAVLERTLPGASDCLQLQFEQQPVGPCQHNNSNNRICTRRISSSSCCTSWSSSRGSEAAANAEGDAAAHMT